MERKSKEAILKEAEMIVNDYIQKIEKSKSSNKVPNYKFEFLKKYSITITIFFIISLIINFI